MQWAVVDRVVQGKAVLLVGDDETEYHLASERLPAGAGEGSRLRVRVDGGAITEATLDVQETEVARTRIEEKLKRLRQRGRD